MGIIHSRASKKNARAQASLANAEAKAVKQGTRQAGQDAVAAKWQPVVDAIAAGEADWDDMSRLEKLSMPLAYQLKCKAAARARRQ
jgi:NAD(P)H-dependent flavin oxidoreductase YrpB (nitropropane dioxygenase family)